ncbi:MAG: methyltransferase domain-containing protein [Clostridia bacterium]|nr:methyltransferase domain-containing protein [Clostridia bacterium]
MLFLCPKCKNKLVEKDGCAICREGHSYDRAKGGYYNLLLGSSGGVHGDNKDMVLARREFLAFGFYSPLAEKLSSLVLQYTNECCVLLDAGSGEGYYTDFVERALHERDADTNVLAFDISKDAVRELAKKNKRISAVVAGSYHIPLPDGSVDTVINTFSPLALDETRRVLKSGGRFIMAIPGEEHLYELKAKIYDTPYKNTVADTAIRGFKLISDESLTYIMHLNSREAVSSLFMMTPYAYRTSPENKARLAGLDSLECTADFRLFVYEKI